MSAAIAIEDRIDASDVEQLYLSGLSCREIGVIKACTADSLLSYLRRHNIPVRSRSDEILLSWQRHRHSADRLVRCKACGGQVYSTIEGLCRVCSRFSREAKYRETHRHLINANSKKYREGHKLQRRNLAAARKTRKGHNGVERFDIQDIIKRDKGICGICRKPVKKADFSIDHIVPISCGGGHIPSNVQVAHKSCNFRKSAGCLPSQMRLRLEVQSV